MAYQVSRNGMNRSPSSSIGPKQWAKLPDPQHCSPSTPHKEHPTSMGTPSYLRLLGHGEMARHLHTKRKPWVSLGQSQSLRGEPTGFGAESAGFRAVLGTYRVGAGCSPQQQHQQHNLHPAAEV